jgi:hypothetical protein
LSNDVPPGVSGNSITTSETTNNGVFGVVHSLALEEGYTYSLSFWYKLGVPSGASYIIATDGNSAVWYNSATAYADTDWIHATGTLNYLTNTPPTSLYFIVEPNASSNQLFTANVADVVITRN